MKHFIALVSIFAILTISAPVLAQQEINNDGVSGSDLQQQADSTYYQNNVGSNQQTSPVAPNAGAAVIQNAPDQVLNVTGAPANTTTQEESTPFRWLVIAVLFLLILMSPALLYARDIKQKEESQSPEPVTASAKTPKKKEAEKASEEEKEEVVAEVTTEETVKESTPPKKKKAAKKKNTSKVKRSKKKKK